MKRLFWKVRDKFRDAYHKIGKHDNYDAILLSNFYTEDMIKNVERKINCKVARKMCTWSNYQLRQAINAKVKRYDFLIVPYIEYYTSKTCSDRGYAKRRKRMQVQKLSLSIRSWCQCSEEYFTQVLDRECNSSPVEHKTVKFLWK